MLVQWYLPHQQLQDVFSLFSLHQQALHLGVLVSLVCLTDPLALVLLPLSGLHSAHSHLMDSCLRLSILGCPGVTGVLPAVFNLLVDRPDNHGLCLS